jgi:hypothetical protein
VRESFSTHQLLERLCQKSELFDEQGLDMFESFSAPKSRICPHCRVHSLFRPRYCDDTVPLCLWQCVHCNGYVLEIDGETVYPIESGIVPSQYMPESAVAIFCEAQSIINLSPRATCALLRSCLECIAQEAGGQGTSLAKKIESLCLSPGLRRLADLCRIYGNDAVHGGQIDFTVSNKEAFAIATALSSFINHLADEIFGTEAIARELEEKITAAHS